MTKTGYQRLTRKPRRYIGLEIALHSIPGLVVVAAIVTFRFEVPPGYSFGVSLLLWLSLVSFLIGREIYRFTYRTRRARAAA